MAININSSPMEIHLVFYNISYSNTSEAFNAKDGKLILTYMCKLDRYENATLDNLTSNLKKINKLGEFIEIDSFALSNLFDNDLQNYHMYWSACEVVRENLVLWIISSKEISINEAQLSRMRSLKGPDNKFIMSNCRLAKLSGGNKVLHVTQHPIDQKKIQSMEEKDNIALAAPEKIDMPSNKPSTSVQTKQKEPEQLLSNKSNINSDVAKKEDVIISVVTTVPTANLTVTNEIRSKKDIKSTKSLDLEDQRKDMEHILNITKPLCSNNKEKNILNDPELTKNIVMSSIDDLMFDLTNYNKAELKPSQRPEVQKNHREGVRMNATALRREMHIKNKDIISIKSHDTEDQREEMELVTENFDSDLNLMQPLDINNREKNIVNDVERTKDNTVMSSKDTVTLNSINQDKVEVKTSQRPSVKKTHREGVRMNATALRREMHIKNKQQINNEKTNKNVHTF
ncbi:hypothetical protein AGLY_012244 [Aphis glycines]|uniref:Alpha-carbonic anhydrase domain-containing protein n=1 Tax=Aphis glycines TaxID=307491 RepID=A0A6G0T9W4_APHGL|nr:hypothetical protein AGLY_012244 [Aphis glycines]